MICDFCLQVKHLAFVYKTTQIFLSMNVDKNNWVIWFFWRSQTNHPRIVHSTLFWDLVCTNQAIEKQYKFNSNLIKFFTNTMQMPHKCLTMPHAYILKVSL
jgi:hypothetical protein